MAFKTVFFDAAGTLIHLRQPVGMVYAQIAREHGIEAEPEALNQAFRSVWKQSPPPVHPAGEGAEDDDRSWWRRLVGLTFAQATGPALPESALETVFTRLYDHFAEPEAWLVYDDVRPTLEKLHGRCRLLVLSNFDKRLRRILAGHGLNHYFEGMIISSEVGASKPHPRIFEAALGRAHASAAECLHVGDDVKADIGGAQAAGMAAVLVKRPEQGLEQVLAMM